MSQWNGLNVHVIKTKRIECSKLELPDVLTKPHLSSASKSKTPTRRSTSASSPTLSSGGGSHGHTSTQRSVTNSSSIDIDSEDSFSSVKTEGDIDEVFQSSFETPSEDAVKHGGCIITRWLSLPACLGCESRERNENEAYFCSRRLFEEALNLESSERGAGREPRAVYEEYRGFWVRFPRDQELRKCRSVSDIEMYQSRTPPAAIINTRQPSNLITDLNNNNSLSQKPVIPHSTTRFRSKSSLDLRRDWEKKILDLTSDATAFGARRIGAKESRIRPRSVTLTGSVYGLVKAQDNTTKERDSERRAKSESKQEMPKLQTTVWNYIKRRSSKRKEKRNSQSKESPSSKEIQKGSPSVTEESKNGRDTASGFHQNEGGEIQSELSAFSQCPTTCESSCQDGKTTRSGTGDSSTSRNIRCLRKWKSTPNLKYCEVALFAEKIAYKTNSWDEIPSRSKDVPKLSVKEFQDRPDYEILRLLLTKKPELRTMEERLKTLSLAREWLVKELKTMREDDRRLARQFINLRSAIVEIKRAREKEESDCDSDGEGHKPRWINSHKITVEKVRHGKGHVFQMHETPTRNILSYC